MGPRPFDEGPLQVPIDVPPERAVVGAAPAGVHPRRGAGIGGKLRRAREAADVADLQENDHGQHPPDPRQGPEELQFRRRPEHRAQALLEGEDLCGHDLELLKETLRRVATVWRQERQGRREPLAATTAEEIARPLEPEPGPWPGWHGSGS